MDNAEQQHAQRQQLLASLSQFDHEWVVERERYLIKQNGGYGPAYVPTLLNSILPALALVGIAAFCIVYRLRSGPSQTYALYGGLLFLALGFFLAIYGSQKAKAYNAAYSRHQQKRAELMTQITAQDG